MADADKDMSSSQIQFTLQVSEATHVYLLYNCITMYEHKEKRPWITTEEWAHSDLLTGNAGKIMLTSADSTEVALEGLRVKTFHAGAINIMGNNGHGRNAPLIFIVKAGEEHKCECCQETKPSNEYDECILRTAKKKSYCVSGVRDMDSA